MEVKKRIAILCGGKSMEHEVSLLSARNVMNALDRDRYAPVLIGIGKDGVWRIYDDFSFLLSGKNPKESALPDGGKEVALMPGGNGKIILLSTPQESMTVDVVFPILHGPFGEDGTVQGLLKLANVPFVGAGVLGSAVGMDKDVMKRLLRDAGIPTAKCRVFTHGQKVDFDAVAAELGAPFFVKPANLGSSVGVSKVRNREECNRAVADAFHYDTKILIEEFVDGREIECAVLGNQNPVASGVGEIIPRHEFYSYEAKYIDEQGAALEVPAKISPEVSERVRELAIKTFATLSCEGLGRVDFFLKKDETLFVNEINTMPGFTKISMYPQLWAASGISYAELVDRLIELALERFQREQNLKTSY